LNELLGSAENWRSVAAEAILARKTRCTGIRQWKPGQAAAEIDPAEGEAPQAGAKLIGRQRRSELLAKRALQ
jgi:hypothetical protein